ncbi:ribonuclease Z [Paenibacillus xylaniclasticus]|uniref:ribonuclease Z n=1 Tax=Paenibacillus xylaniclasticus TaxID=588083 RepID=UPI000FD9C030|nr:MULTISPECIES: ribonuclease Z [Paenibacillus]GFN32372.1 ribonuclease Z [Paenibacillus curdlanolyticus]
MELTFLGTGAGRPSRQRNVTSAALRLPSPSNSVWLFDAGEGTQHKLLETSIKLNRIDRIFITHMHGDHTFGLAGLLSTRAYDGGVDPVTVYGPKGLREMLQSMLDWSGTRITYDIHYVEVEEGIIYDDGQFSVEAAALEHRVPCFGYRIVERDRLGRLDAAKLKEAGVPAGPLYGRLKAGDDIVLDDGLIVCSADVTGPCIPGRVVTILGDTKPCSGALRLARGADLLVHEATFEAGLEEKAEAYGHATTVQAAEIAREAGAHKLVMTHFSSRYDLDEAARLEEEARTRFPASFAAYDGAQFSVECRC